MRHLSEGYSKMWHVALFPHSLFLKNGSSTYESIMLHLIYLFGPIIIPKSRSKSLSSSILSEQISQQKLSVYITPFLWIQSTTIMISLMSFSSLPPLSRISSLTPPWKHLKTTPITINTIVGFTKNHKFYQIISHSLFLSKKKIPHPLSAHSDLRLTELKAECCPKLVEVRLLLLGRLGMRRKKVNSWALTCSW